MATDIIGMVSDFFENMLSFTENKVIAIAVIIGAVLFALAIIGLFIFVAVRWEEPIDIATAEKTGQFSDYAKAYCIDQGYAKSKWINETDPNDKRFTCANETEDDVFGENKTITDFYIP